MMGFKGYLKVVTNTCLYMKLWLEKKLSLSLMSFEVFVKFKAKESERSLETREYEGEC